MSEVLSDSELLIHSRITDQQSRHQEQRTLMVFHLLPFHPQSRDRQRLCRKEGSVRSDLFDQILLNSFCEPVLANCAFSEMKITEPVSLIDGKVASHSPALTTKFYGTTLAFRHRQRGSFS